MSDEDMVVRHVTRDQFEVEIGGHTVTVDQPAADGGSDAGPTPTELFVAGLAACTAHYARRYLARHDLSDEGLEVSASYRIHDRPVRVSDIALHITPPSGLPIERRNGLLAVASHCTVHNTLSQPPTVTISLD